MANTVITAMMQGYDEQAVSMNNEFFLQRLFWDENVFASTEVEVDIQRDSEKIAIDVIRGGGNVGNGNQADIYTSKTYTPPMYNEYGFVTATQLTKRIPNQPKYSNIDKEAAFMYYAGKINRKNTMKIMRAIELQAAQALLTGTVTLTNGESLDFKMKSSHKLTPSIKWDQSTGVPITDISNHVDTIFKDGKVIPNVAIFGQKAWSVFWANPQVQKYLDNRRFDQGRIEPSERLNGARYKGTLEIGDAVLDLYTYSNFYTNSSGTQTVYLTTDSVILMNKDALLQKAYAETEVMPKYEEMYREEGMPEGLEFAGGKLVPYTYDAPPTSQAVGVQSAPLVIPTAIDTIGSINNVDS